MILEEANKLLLEEYGSKVFAERQIALAALNNEVKNTDKEDLHFFIDHVFSSLYFCDSYSVEDMLEILEGFGYRCENKKIISLCTAIKNTSRSW